MIITCNNCKKRYNLDASSISKPQFKVRCAHCNHGFIVSKEPAVTQKPFAPNTGRSPDRHAVFAISNQKGGVAKTSTCLNLGMSLALLGKKVLLIDFDVQANLTTSLGFASRSLSFFDILYSGSESISDYIHKTRFPGVSLLPSNSRMALLTKYYMYRPGFETLLRNRLAQVVEQYDFILIDTPPAIGFCTLNALMAADHVLIPTPCEYLSMHGIHKIEDIIQFVRKKSRRDIDYHILISMHSRRSTSSEVIYRKIMDMFGDKVLATIIEHDEKMKESQIVNLPVIEYDRTSPSARQFMQLARELIAATNGNDQRPD
jgi:chromosome partitioning protein